MARRVVELKKGLPGLLGPWGEGGSDSVMGFAAFRTEKQVHAIRTVHIRIGPSQCVSPQDLGGVTTWGQNLGSIP